MQSQKYPPVGGSGVPLLVGEAPNATNYGSLLGVPNIPPSSMYAGYTGAGGTLPKPVNQIQGRKKKLEAGAKFLIITPAIFYAVFLLLFTWLSFFYPIRLQTGAAITCAFLGGVMYKAQWDGPVRFGAMLSLFAVILGSLAGWYLHETRAQFWYGYRYGERYNNVVPSQAAASLADAAVIGFEDDAYLDAPNAAGFTPIGAEGKEYCVSPIMAPDQEGEVQFWAGGTDCCYARASFWCDAAAAKGRKSGVVIFDTGIFKTAIDHYRDAIKIAEATWEVKSAPEPLIVRFVEDSMVDATIQEMHDVTMLEAFIGVVIGMVLFGGAANVGASAFYVD